MHIFTKKLKKGVLTIEAAYIVPIATLIIAMVIGYIYFTHQRIWIKGMIYQEEIGCLYLQDRERVGETLMTELNEKINAMPLEAGSFKLEPTVSRLKISVTVSLNMFEGLFEDIFNETKEIWVSRVNPAALKRISKVLEE